MQVRVNGHLSNEYGITSGVPQGSHLGPILFSIFINDIGIKLKSEFLLYADDMKLFRAVGGNHDICILERDILEIENWCTTNKLHLNIQKCAVMCFSRRLNKVSANYSLCGQTVKTVNSIKDLGVIVDDKLSFSEHINHISLRAYRALGFICRSGKEFRNHRTLLRLFLPLCSRYLNIAPLFGRHLLRSK